MMYRMASFLPKKKVINRFIQRSIRDDRLSAVENTATVDILGFDASQDRPAIKRAIRKIDALAVKLGGEKSQIEDKTILMDPVLPGAYLAYTFWDKGRK